MNFTAATVFSQIFRQINILLKDFTVNQFDEKIYVAWQCTEFLVFSHCVTWQWIHRFPHCKKIRENILQRNLVLFSFDFTNFCEIMNMMGLEIAETLSSPQKNTIGVILDSFFLER